ncbi:MAG TPA: hypothetical protein VFX49_10910 [Chloroflexota bacterium]|nr:hypothetical protein [Chloroflexota bacterium]
MLPTQIHERYLYPAVALLCFSLHRAPAVPPLYGLLALGLFANLARIVPWDDRVPATLAGVGLGAWGAALVNTFGFAGMTLHFLFGVPSRRLAGYGAAAAAFTAVMLQVSPPNW